MNMLGPLITALENRAKALEAEAVKLAQEGEAEAAALKTALANELRNIVAEIESVLADL
jgi:hypothetical protein